MLIVGLQNSEKKYEKTRHNVGAIVLNHYVKKHGGEFVFDKYTNSFRATPELCNIYLPNTYMNLSGESIQKIIKKEFDSLSLKTLTASEILIFFDDATIPVGEFKISVGEGASSHNGIKSVVQALETFNLTKDKFTRVRIGVGKVIKDQNGKEKIYEPGPDKFSDFVLSNLNNLEIVQIQSMSDEIIQKLCI